MIPEDKFSVLQVFCVSNQFYTILFSLLASRLFLYWYIISNLNQEIDKEN